MKLLRSGLIILTLTILASSFILSNQTSVESLKVSDQVLLVFDLVPHQDVVNQTGKYSYYSELMREVAHVVMYSFIGSCVYLMFLSWTRRNWISVLLTLVLVMGYACFDEYHQVFVEGRGYQWLDLVLDFIGCSSALLVAAMATIVNRLMMKHEQFPKIRQHKGVKLEKKVDGPQNFLFSTRMKMPS